MADATVFIILVISLCRVGVVIFCENDVCAKTLALKSLHSMFGISRFSHPIKNIGEFILAQG